MSKVKIKKIKKGKGKEIGKSSLILLPLSELTAVVLGVRTKGEVTNKEALNETVSSTI